MIRFICIHVYLYYLLEPRDTNVFPILQNLQPSLVAILLRPDPPGVPNGSTSPS